MLSKEEYVEQAYFFGMLLERLRLNIPLQELLAQARHELLASTRLPMAVDLLLTELKHSGQMNPGMKLLSHYFAPYQTYLVFEAENDRGKFDYRTALRILQAEAAYRAAQPNRQGLFFYQFEAISRNRLNYDRGLLAMSQDDFYDRAWADWILILRRQLGLVDIADMIHVRSQSYHDYRARRGESASDAPVLFGVQEGKIAAANHQKDPLFLFAAMQRHLGYPEVPKLEILDPLPTLVPQLMRRMERLEARIKLMEEEQRDGLDITKFFGGKTPHSLDDVD